MDVSRCGCGLACCGVLVAVPHRINSQCMLLSDTGAAVARVLGCKFRGPLPGQRMRLLALPQEQRLVQPRQSRLAPKKSHITKAGVYGPQPKKLAESDQRHKQLQKRTSKELLQGTPSIFLQYTQRASLVCLEASTQ